MISIEHIDQTENEVQAIVTTDCFGSHHPERCYTLCLDLVARQAGVPVDERHRADYVVYEEDAVCRGGQLRYPDWMFSFKNEMVLSIRMGHHRAGISRGKRVWVRFWRVPKGGGKCS